VVDGGYFRGRVHSVAGFILLMKLLFPEFLKPK
jgi:hypothetical protein